MKFVYFTKMLKALDLKGLIAFCKDVGLGGLDLAVRPGYAVSPDNMAKALPEAAKALADEGLTIGLVTADTGLNDSASKTAKALFEASAAAGVPAIKIGYFAYKNDFDANFKDARTKLEGFAKLAAEHKVKACVHTHSGNNIPNNCATLRMLLQDLDAHHVGLRVAMLIDRRPGFRIADFEHQHCLVGPRSGGEKGLVRRWVDEDVVEHLVAGGGRAVAHAQARGQVDPLAVVLWEVHLSVRRVAEFRAVSRRNLWRDTGRNKQRGQ